MHIYPPPRSDRWDPWFVGIVFAILAAAVTVLARR